MSSNVLFSRIIFHGQSVKNWQVFSVLAIGASNLNMYHNKLFLSHAVLLDIQFI